MVAKIKEIVKNVDRRYIWLVMLFSSAFILVMVRFCFGGQIEYVEYTYPADELYEMQMVIVQDGVRDLVPGRLQGQITIGADGVTGRVHPMTAITEADVLASEIIFESLLAIGAGGFVTGVLAESFYVSDDGHTYVFYLRDHVLFSDGTLLNADIVKQGFLYFSSLTAETVHTQHLSRLYGFRDFAMGMVDNISGIVPDNDNGTISFTFSEPRGDNLWAFLTPIVHHNFGTGPFYFRGFDEGVITLAANHYYHRGRAYLDYVFIRSANLASAPLLLERGNIDLFWTDYNKDLLRQVDAMPSISIGAFSGSQQGFIGFNNLNPLLANPNIREALALGSNVSQVTENVFGLFAQGGSPIVPEYFWLSESPGTYVAFDPERAVSLIEDEGFSINGAGVFERNGQELRFRLYTLGSETFWELCNSIATNWREIGISVTVQVLTFGSMRQAIESGDFDMMYLTMRVDFDTDFTSFTGDNVFFNSVRWFDDEAAKLAAKINQPCILGARQAFNAWQEVYSASHVRLHVDRPKRVVFFNPHIRGLAPYGHRPFTWNIERWSIYP